MSMCFLAIIGFLLRAVLAVFDEYPLHSGGHFWNGIALLIIAPFIGLLMDATVNLVRLGNLLARKVQSLFRFQ